MENPLDQTTLSTISLLESRLLRVEHLLHGSSTPPTQHDSALRQLADLEKRFSTLTSRIRVYGDLLKIYKAHPDLFQAPRATEPPSQLPADAVRAIVLSAAPSFPATASALTAVRDTPVPDPAESAALAALAGRLRVCEAAQAAQEAEVAELRGRSEAALRTWYEGGLLPTSEATARVEARVGGVERRVRQKERERAVLEKEI